jgi:LDH2 family malate/lactate/ureidoglycolate dehydrogenase
MLVDCPLGVNLSASRMPTPPSADKPTRYGVEAVRNFARELASRSGMRADIARDLADVLLDADLLGHTTHGLALLSPYLDELAAGRMAKEGEPKVLSRRAATETWDGERLPGPWLTLRALDRASAMAREYGTGTVVVRRSHHIACLAAYLRRATDQGLIAIIECSDPTVAAVVPHGGTTPYITPNPIAAGLPTSRDPIMIDVSTSITSNGYAHQERLAGRLLPGPWLIDAEGNATADPRVLVGESKGALLPLGGLDAGHKGFALAILIEAMTAGLAGYGRVDSPAGWGATVFVQVLDPEAFGGLAAFKRQMDALVDSAHNSKPRSGVDRVRLPGERGSQRFREQTAHGVALYPTIMPALAVWAQKYGVPIPTAIEG